jgi:hypothetical protein
VCCFIGIYGKKNLRIIPPIEKDTAIKQRYYNQTKKLQSNKDNAIKDITIKQIYFNQTKLLQLNKDNVIIDTTIKITAMKQK